MPSLRVFRTNNVKIGRNEHYSLSDRGSQRVTRKYWFIFVCLFLARQAPLGHRASPLTSFLDHTQRRTTVGRNPMDEWSARRRDLYLTTHNTHNRQTFMPPVRFKPTISAGERPQTYALDFAAIGTGGSFLLATKIFADHHFKKFSILVCMYVSPNVCVYKPLLTPNDKL